MNEREFIAELTYTLSHGRRRSMKQVGEDCVIYKSDTGNVKEPILGRKVIEIKELKWNVKT